MDAEQALANYRMGTRHTRASREGKPIGKALSRLCLNFDCQRAAKDEFWRRVLADPDTYGDALEDARLLLEHHEQNAKKAHARYQYLLSLSPKEE